MDKYNLFDVRVAGFIFNDKQELLLLKNRQGTWGILGGHLEKGEQIKDTMHREAMEEAGIQIRIVKMFGLRNIGDSFIVGFACKYVKGSIILQPEEIQDYKWVLLDELSKFNLTFKELPVEALKAKDLIFAL